MYAEGQRPGVVLAEQICPPSQVATSLGLCTLVAEDDILVSCSSSFFFFCFGGEVGFMFSAAVSVCPAPGRAGYHGVLREPVHAVLRQSGRELSRHPPADEPAPHQRAAVLGAAAHHLRGQPAQRRPAHVRPTHLRFINPPGIWKQTGSTFFPQTSA